jgi:hypothetical protein
MIHEFSEACEPVQIEGDASRVAAGVCSKSETVGIEANATHDPQAAATADAA